jgi:hypothetical protein
MPKKRKARRNPYPSADGEWLACHGIRKLPTGEIQLLTEKGVLSNPARRKSFINKVKKLFSANPGTSKGHYKIYYELNGKDSVQNKDTKTQAQAFARKIKKKGGTVYSIMESAFEQ